MSVYQIVSIEKEWDGHADYMDIMKVVTESYGNDPLPLFKNKLSALTFIEDNHLSVYDYNIIELEVLYYE